MQFSSKTRWKAGVAATLNYIDLNSTEKSPKLRPYPSWEANKLPIDVQPQDQKTPSGGRLDADKAQDAGVQLKDNSTIISTFRIQVDVCDRLWVLDTGLADILGNPKQITPNSILVFDLKTDTLLRRFTIPADQTKEDTFFANIVSLQRFAKKLYITKYKFCRLLMPIARTARMLLPIFLTWALMESLCTL